MECGSIGGGGLPMWTLIKDPVVPIDPKKIGLSPVGVKLIEINGVWHVLDWVGEKHYPMATDFIEEAVRLGLSRRISKTEEFSKLTADSRLILVHPKAFISDPMGTISKPIPCPTENHPDPDFRSECIGRLWLIGTPGSTDLGSGVEPPMDSFPAWAPCPISGDGYVGRRKMPAFTYSLGEQTSEHEIELSPGIIMIAPIERLCVVNDPHDPDHIREVLDMASESSIPVNLDDC
jgi:hypothetical protein